MKPTFVCNSEHFIKTNYPKFLELCERACIDVKKHQMCIVIPTKSKIAEYNKEMNKFFGDLSVFLGGSEKELEDRRNKVLDLKSKLYAHFIKQVITPDYKGGIEANGSNQQVKLSAVKGGKIEIYSGGKFETKAEGKLADVMGTPNYSSGYRNVSFIVLSSGELDINGPAATQTNSKAKLATKLDGAGPEVLPNDARIYAIKQSANDMILEACKGTKKNFYIPVVAGLMKCLEQMGDEQCRKYAHYIYPCAASTFYVLVQPHNELGQFLSDDIIGRWMCAPYFCDDYKKQRSDFLLKYSPQGERIKIAEAIKNYPETKGINQGFEKLYSDTYSKLFPAGFSSGEKLWADELAYRIYISMKDDVTSCHNADELAKTYSGKSMETLSGDKAFWDNIISRGYDDKIQDFFRGDWFLHKGGVELHYSDGPSMPSYYKKLIELNK